jgi:hypothetical protein
MKNCGSAEIDLHQPRSHPTVMVEGIEAYELHKPALVVHDIKSKAARLEHGSPPP